MFRFIALVVVTTLVPGCLSREISQFIAGLPGCSTGEDASDAGAESGETEDSADASTSDDTSSTTTAPSSSTGDASGTSSSTSTGADTDDTSPEGPVCGNGIVEPFGPVPEECDDGNQIPDDGCSETCAVDRLVFVSSKQYHAWELESLYIADGYCANMAAWAGLPDYLTYRAWLSDSQGDARDRIKRGRGRLMLVNGLVFAKSWDALFAGEIDHPPDVTEVSEVYQSGVWTGTRPDGTAVPGSEHCEDWTSKSVFKTAYWGWSDMTTAEWTIALANPQPTSCGDYFAIYCFQSL